MRGMPNHENASLPPDTVRTLPELLAWRVAATPHAEAYRHFDAVAQAWTSLSWADFAARVDRWKAALSEVPLTPGARVAILLPNGVDAVCADQATLALGGVPVPLHAIDNPGSVAYILSDSEATVLVAATESQWTAIAGVGQGLPALRQVVVLQRDGSAGMLAGGPALHALADWLDAAPAAPAAPVHAPSAEDLAALVYTSGTTGRPKGVMLTHRNVLSNVTACLQRVAPTAQDVFLSFLPLSHTFERTAGYYLPIAAGCCVAFARSVPLLGEDLKTVRPTVLISVPRIYERVYAKLQSALPPGSLKARLFARAEAVGWRRYARRHGLAVPRGGSAVADELAWPVLDTLVARRLRAEFGGRVRVAVSGGAPLSPTIAHCFLGLGLPVLQGYGMTETSPVVAVNTADDNDPATVGRALPAVELRIGDQRELLVRGPNVMRGYWKRDEDTQRSFTDGWLRTGDQAALENGRLRIVGRVKEIIVTATGEKIAPADLELAITADPLFEQAFAFGDNRPFIACLVVLARTEWARLAATLQIDPQAPASLDAPVAREAVLQRVRSLTAAFPHYAQPRAVAMTLEAWTIENGLMTPTLKLKRLPLAARFADAIEALYRK